MEWGKMRQFQLLPKNIIECSVATQEQVNSLPDMEAAMATIFVAKK